MKINYSDKKQNNVRIRSMFIGLGGLLILGIIFSIIQLTTAAPDWPTVGHPWVDMQCDANMCVNTGTSLVGVGINSPASKLHVKDGHTWGSDLSIDATGTTGGRRWLLISTGGNAGEGQGKLLIKDNTGGTRIAIDTAGQVGIGTTGPGQRLDVSGGNIRTSGELISTNANQARFISGNYGVIHRNDGSNYYILLTASGDQYGSWNTLRPFRIANDTGHVYLGNIHLAGYLYDYNNSAGSSGQVLTRSAYGVAWQTSTSLPTGSSGQTLRHDGTSWVASSVLYNNGTNVGIGTTSPSQKLHVAGNMRLTGYLYDYNNSAGSSGQVLTRSTYGVTWQNASGGTLDCINPSSGWVDSTQTYETCPSTHPIATGGGCSTYSTYRTISGSYGYYGSEWWCVRGRCVEPFCDGRIQAHAVCCRLQ